VQIKEHLMVKDLAIVFALIMAVMVGSFAGSAAALHEVKRDIIVEMTALRAQVEPASCKLFSGSYQP
jgi:hypothetical protein